MKSIKKRSKFSAIFDFRYLFYDFVKVTGVIPCMIYYRLKTYCFKKKKKELFNEPVIVVSNHITYTDIVVLLATFWNKRVSFIAKDELFQSFIGNLFFKGVKAIPVQNKNIEINTFKKAQYELSRGHLVALFPEGHIKTQVGFDTFKNGAVLLALMCDAPIVSVYIKEKKHWWERQRVMFGNKINIKDYFTNETPTIDEISKVTQMLYDHELELENKMESILKK